MFIRMIASYLYIRGQQDFVQFNFSFDITGKD